MTEHVIVPHELAVWRKFRAMAQPGDVMRTALRPPYAGAHHMPHAAWLRELLAALDEGLEVHVEEAGALRHGRAIAKALCQTMAEHEAETARRRTEAQRSVAEAETELTTEYRRGFDDGLEAAQLAEKAAADRAKARERKRRQREHEAHEQAERDATARADIKSSNFATAGA